MFLTEQNGTQMWTKMLKENFNVTDTEKLNWVSQYAAIHEIHESALGVQNGAVVGGGAGNVNPIYATPLNTTGMGNVAPAGDPSVGGINGFRAQTAGSGDVPVSTLPMALNIALMTIGLELVPVVPAKAPWAMLSYMDFPYAGGKLGRDNEVASIDGKHGNHPLYVKVKATDDALTALGTKKPGDEVIFTDLKGVYVQRGRMDGGIIIRVTDTKGTRTRGEGENAVNVTEQLSVREAATGFEVDFAQTMVDFIDGYSNFATGKTDPMSRAENETGTGNVIGLRLFSKWVQMGSYEVTGTVTRQQLQDLPLYGVDAVAKVMEALQNEITQSINARILETVFRLGVTNAVNQRNYHNVDLNLFLTDNPTAKISIKDMGVKEYMDIDGNDYADGWEVANAEVMTAAENLHTRQRRVASRILAAANLIQTTGRRGRATWAVTNAQVATALQDVSSYVVAPMANTLAQDGSQNLFLGGTLAGLKIYVDPYMNWDDTRVCVGRKGNGNEPGVVFMPYILADTVSITAEGTMAPKMLVNSRFAITQAGFYPEAQYYTFAVKVASGLV
jgi:hypothetical protein